MRSTTRSKTGRTTKAPKLDRMKGQIFGRLSVVGFTGKYTKHKQKLLTCRCACGNVVDVQPAHLRSGATQSCGCLHSEVVKERNKVYAKHGGTMNGKRSDLYKAWDAIRQRCHNPKNKAFVDYGGRGIEMHEPWRTSYAEFERDVAAEIGAKPNRTYSLDRKDNGRGYEPGNLRWATPTEQNRNRRNTVFYELRGEKRTIAEWAQLANIPYDTVKRRVLGFGWPLDEALGTPVGFGRCPISDRQKWTEKKGSGKR